MRTYNKHPQWSNVPLRLTEEEKRNPALVLEEYFQCYHLQDVRQILWNWMVEVISSPHGISCDPHERNNHIYFYEKMEALIEAAYIMQKKIQKQQKKKHRRRKKAQVSSWR